MIRKFNTLYELATAIGWVWPADMPDRSSRFKFQVADTEAECYTVHEDDGKIVRKHNTETLDKWLSDFNTPRWSPEYQCMVTQAHYNRCELPHLRGVSAPPQELAAVKRWQENNPDKIQVISARNSNLPENKQRKPCKLTKLRDITV